MTSILIVEDASIVAADLDMKLRQLGFSVAGMADSGEEAVAMARERRPDLVLMDIHLPGAMDGIQAAQVIRREFDVPVIFLTAHSDSATLERAKLTDPYGYVLKPFEDRDLQTHIQMGLHMHAAGRELRESENRLRRFYESGLLGVIYWDMTGRITDANDKFLDMVGYTREDLTAGRIDWLRMTPPEFRPLDEASMAELKATGANKTPFEKEYIRKDGSRLPVAVAGAMLDAARTQGVAFVYDVSERKRAENALSDSRAAALNLMRDAVAARKEAERVNEELMREIAERKRAEEELRRNAEQLRIVNEELSSFNRVAVGRELRMVELKKQVNDLCVKAGLPPRYDVEFEEGNGRHQRGTAP